jgi:hypothetical protein
MDSNASRNVSASVSLVAAKASNIVECNFIFVFEIRQNVFCLIPTSVICAPARVCRIQYII